MRSLLATASCIAFVALLAGCSNPSQGISAVPGSPVGQPPASQHERAATIHGWKDPAKQLGKKNILKLMADGKFPARQLHRAFMVSYQHFLKNPHFMPRISHDRGKLGLWVSTLFYSELVGLTANAKKALINVDVQGCSYPGSVKVDAGKNVWTNCEYGNGTNGGALQEYSPSGTLLAQYTSACPSNLPAGSCNDGWFSYFFDAATGGNLACGAAVEFEAESSASSYVYGTGFICWPRGNPSAGSSLIPIWSCNQNGSCSGSDCDPVCEVWAADMDSSGNIYFTYYGESSSCFGGGIGEVLNPGQPSQSINIIASPCTLEFPGSAYVSNYSTVLDALDQDARLIYQYHLPLSSSSTPFRTLGPTKTNGSGNGDPDGMGFNQSDTKVITGDEDWFDVGKVKNNKWSILTSSVVGSPAYTPSDK